MQQQSFVGNVSGLNDLLATGQQRLAPDPAPASIGQSLSLAARQEGR
jgi:hypothetical protein